MTGYVACLSRQYARSFFLSGQLLLGNLSKTVVVVGNTPHNRPSFLVCHLIGNRASFLCTEAPMLRVPDELAALPRVHWSKEASSLRFANASDQRPRDIAVANAATLVRRSMMTLFDRLSTKAEVEDSKSVTSSAKPNRAS